MTCLATQQSACCRRRGFSLAELIIAIGILAVGMVMVGALFPAAIRANRSTHRNVLGSIICESGIAVAKARYSTNPKPPGQTTQMPLGNTMLVVEADDLVTGLLNRQGRQYPQDDINSPYGFMWAARRLDDDDDDETFEGYQMVMVSFKRREPAGRVKFAQRPVAYQPGTTSISMNLTSGANTKADLLRNGSPVINRKTGDYATITQAASSGQACSIDRPLVPAGGSASNEALNVYMVVEQTTDAGQWVDERFSPAMTTMVTRFGLLGD
jgi:prepilin-type N-terminal cleavage/methylation domain-containing protein